MKPPLRSLFLLATLSLVAALPAVPAGPEIQPGPYSLGPDSHPQPGVPQGREEKIALPTSRIFPGAEHECWIYLPAGHDPEKPACVMVFQDGGGYVTRDGAWRVPVVFDNLIHRGEMPATVGVFINPGVVPPPREGALPRYNRSFEYDGRGDRYARFLLEEVFPEVGKKAKLSADPNDRAIAGASSGAICAFTAAWERPDAFRRVLSTIGTYVGLRGGEQYSTLVRKTAPQPLRIFLQDGTADLNIYGGDWWVANLAMQRALEFAGYEVNHAWGDGGHDSRHGAAILPDALRWLWGGWPEPVRANPQGRSRQPVAEWLDPDSDWELVSEGHANTEGPCANSRGEVFFTDAPRGFIHKVAHDGSVGVFAEDTGGADGLMFGPDGRLYATNQRRTIVSYDEEGRPTTVAEGFAGNDLCVTHAGGLYVTEFTAGKVWHIPAPAAPGAPHGTPRVVAEGISRPNGVVLSPDQTLLYVADTAGRFVHSFQVQPDGSLAHGQPYFHLHQPDEGGSRADGLAVDRAGRLYAATALGVQICDQAGRVNAILPRPAPGPLSNVDFGGAEMNELYVTAGPRVFKRRLRLQGVRSADEPFTPEKPRL